MPFASFEWADFITPLALVGVVYASLIAIKQDDLKRLVAYSSIAHIGLMCAACFAQNILSVQGVMMQMFNHGTITAMLFLIVGVIYDRAHTRGLNDFGGLMNQMPKYSGVMTVAFFAALGLPGLSGFISEAFVFLGAFQSTAIRTITIASTIGIVLTAGYMLWTLQRVFLGTLPEKWKSLPDINGRELFTLVPLAVIVIFLGIYPSPMIDLMTSAVNALVGVLNSGGGLALIGH